MKAEIMIPESMTTASIAFVLDVRNERETIIIGSYENILDYLTKGKNSNDIQISSRKLGTLAEEMNELAMADNRMEEIIEAFNGLYNNISEAQGNKNAEQYISALNGIYSRAPRANMLRNYIIFFFLQTICVFIRNRVTNITFFLPKPKRVPKSFLLSTIR